MYDLSHWCMPEKLTCRRMYLDDLAPELILAIFQHCMSIADVMSLSRTCRRIHSMLSASQQTLILYRTAELEYGPLCDLLQLLTLNNSQPAHLIRDPPRSDSLLRRIIVVGRIAKRWEEIYPLCKWDSDFAERRFLSVHERYRLRRAIYRYWLYTNAFHTPIYSRTTRRISQFVLRRAKLLQNWSTRELIEIDDFQTTMRALISSKICPSNSRVQAMCLESGEYLPIYLAKQPLTIAAQDLFHSSRDGCKADEQEFDPMDQFSGWGDPVTHYYIIEDLLKLDPRAVLWLYDHPQRYHIEGYLNSLGEWFCNNGDTFSETLACVLQRRRVDLAEEDGNSSYGIIEKNRSSILVSEL